MSRGTQAFYCFIFACGLCVSFYIIWWRQSWFDGAIAAGASCMVLIPLFVRREFAFVEDMERETKANLHAQMLASNEMLRLAREGDKELLLAIQNEHAARLKWWQEEYARAIEHNAILEKRLQPFIREHDKKTGKFLAKSTRLLSHDP